jgi:putative effector of murein hydrolase LrgA (UPF0299 family)
MKKIKEFIRKFEWANILILVLIIMFIYCDVWIIKMQLKFGIDGWYWLAPGIFSVCIIAIIYGWLKDTIPTWKENFK